MGHVLIISLILLFLITIPLLIYYSYQLVFMDAKSRQISKPKFWAILASSSQNGAGIFFYLFKRRGTVSHLTDEELKKIEKIKRRIYILFGVDLLMVIIALVVLFIQS